MTYVTKDDMLKYKASKEDLGRIVSTIKAIQGCEMAVVVYPVEEDVYKVSFRCNPPYDVASIAKRFSGGGHSLAAGATLNGSLEEVQAQLKKVLYSEKGKV